MKIKTKKGVIECVESADPDYKGVWIMINGKELVLVEYDATIGEHSIKVWDHEHTTQNSDYVYNQTVRNDNHEY